MTDVPLLERFVLIAFLIEAVVNLLWNMYTADPAKKWWQCVNWKGLLAIFVGEIVVFGFGLDLFKILGFTGVAWWLGTSLTGLLVSRGSNFLHDVVQFVRNLKLKTEADNIQTRMSTSNMIQR